MSITFEAANAAHNQLQQLLTNQLQTEGWHIKPTGYHDFCPTAMTEALRGDFSPTALGVRGLPDLLLTNGRKTIWAELKANDGKHANFAVEALPLARAAAKERLFFEETLYILKDFGHASTSRKAQSAKAVNANLLASMASRVIIPKGCKRESKTIFSEPSVKADNGARFHPRSLTPKAAMTYASSSTLT